MRSKLRALESQLFCERAEAVVSLAVDRLVVHWDFAIDRGHRGTDPDELVETILAADIYLPSLEMVSGYLSAAADCGTKPKRERLLKMLMPWYRRHPSDWRS